jgi:hypothetical protein
MKRRDRRRGAPRHSGRNVASGGKLPVGTALFRVVDNLLDVA